MAEGLGYQYGGVLNWKSGLQVHVYARMMLLSKSNEDRALTRREDR
jgi:hypothetical protein